MNGLSTDYVSSLYASEPALRDRLVDAGRAADDLGDGRRRCGRSLGLLLAGAERENGG